MKKINSTYIEKLQIINNPWISTEGIMILLPISKNSADKVRLQIQKEMDNNNEFYFKNNRPILIPTKKIIEKFYINVKTITKEAKRMKGD